MCRLFGLSGGSRPVRASFWLLEAPDSLAVQSRREPDGTGIGYIDQAGVAHVDKQPIAAYKDRAFAAEAHHVEAPLCVAHVRYASTGERTVANTHPFEQRGRLFAQNGVIEDLPALEAELGDYRSLVGGETDSERFFALVTKETEARGGDVEGGIVAAARFAARNLALYAINLVLLAGGDLWALRYPQTHDLLVCDAPAADPARLERRSSTGSRIGLAPAGDTVVVASERMDSSERWRELRSGELVHVDASLTVSSAVVLDEPPRRPLRLSDLRAQASQSQQAP